MQLKLYLFNKSIIDIISREHCLCGVIQTQVMRVQKNDEALREKVGNVLALRLARLGGGTSVPPDRCSKFSRVQYLRLGAVETATDGPAGVGVHNAVATAFARDVQASL